MRHTRSLLAILCPCYSGFVYEDAYQDDDDYCCFYSKGDEDDLDSILSEEFVF